MDESKAVLGIDWGTTNRRAYLLDAQGNLLRKHTDDRGILAVGPGNFEASLNDLLQQLGLKHANVVLSGMVGSRNGWHQVPYLATDRPLSSLPDTLVEVDSSLAEVRCRIVPGYQFSDELGTPDVMRGEETQIFGAVVAGAPDGWFVHPGTHGKWVRVMHGYVMEIMTFMTGELFALLSEHGTLAGLMADRQTVPDAFNAGLEAAQRHGFTHAAFGCRALVVTDAMPAAHAASYLSGLLIGAEFADIGLKAARSSCGPIQVIGSPSLSARYVDALQFFDMQAQIWQPDDVYVEALRRLVGIVK